MELRLVLEHVRAGILDRERSILYLLDIEADVLSAGSLFLHALEPVLACGDPIFRNAEELAVDVFFFCDRLDHVDRVAGRAPHIPALPCAEHDDKIGKVSICISSKERSGVRGGHSFAGGVLVYHDDPLACLRDRICGKRSSQTCANDNDVGREIARQRMMPRQMHVL